MPKSTEPDDRTPAQPAPETIPAEPAGNKPEEIGGRPGLEPTRYGDWEKNGIVSDF